MENHHPLDTRLQYHPRNLLTLKKCLLTTVVMLFATASSFALVPHHYSEEPYQFASLSNFDENSQQHYHVEQLQDYDDVNSQSRYNSKIGTTTKQRRRQSNKSRIRIDATADDDSNFNNRNYDEVDSYQATILRSLEQKHHIEYQYDQITFQHDSQQRALNTLSRILTRLEHKNNFHRINSNSGKDDNDDVNDDNNNNNNNRNKNRKLQDEDVGNEFENAFGQGKPGSVYGYNMFCGISWAEASTSCEQRQNCPSGQTSECVTPGHECWAFTECDTRRGDGESFSEHHDVVPGENLSASGVGAVATGGYVDLTKPSVDKTDHYFCGRGYEDARTKCSTHCPSGNMNDCPYGEICFTSTPCDARMMTIAPAPPSPTQRPTTPAPVVYVNKLNKYYCGYDWEDAQERCEVWCPSGSDDDCPDEQVCMAFTECHAVDMNGKTLEQLEQQQLEQQQHEANGPPRSPSPTIVRSPTERPTKRPVLSAEEAMHRYSFCGEFWLDARDNCETKQHCEDDNDCPEAESCWTQTPCDYYATGSPTTGAPSTRPTEAPTVPGPTRSPTKR